MIIRKCPTCNGRAREKTIEGKRFLICSQRHAHAWIDDDKEDA